MIKCDAPCVIPRILCSLVLAFKVAVVRDKFNYLMVTTQWPLMQQSTTHRVMGTIVSSDNGWPLSLLVLFLDILCFRNCPYHKFTVITSVEAKKKNQWSWITILFWHHNDPKLTQTSSSHKTFDQILKAIKLWLWWGHVWPNSCSFEESCLFDFVDSLKRKWLAFDEILACQIALVMPHRNMKNKYKSPQNKIKILEQNVQWL